MTIYNIVDSPIGPLTLLSDGEHIIGVYMSDHLRGPEVDPTWVFAPEAYPLTVAREQLIAYFDGTLTQFDLPLMAHGTPFQRLVWSELSKIPYGVTISYGELARRIGNPNASRAVGLANGRNPISIVVPCHRVIGANGKLVGFGGGLDRKSALLNLEQKRNSCPIELDLFS